MTEEEIKKVFEAWKAAEKTANPPENHYHFAPWMQRQCPSCGHCPTCGRSNGYYTGPWITYLTNT